MSQHIPPPTARLGDEIRMLRWAAHHDHSDSQGVAGGVICPACAHSRDMRILRDKLAARADAAERDRDAALANAAYWEDSAHRWREDFRAATLVLEGEWTHDQIEERMKVARQMLEDTAYKVAAEHGEPNH